MKKILLTIVLLCAFSFLPIKSMAMLEVEENGNTITKDIDNDEITTLMAPDESVSSDGQKGTGDTGVIPDKSVDGQKTGNDTILLGERDASITASDSELLYETTAVEEDNYVTTAKESETSNWSYIMIAGIVGAILGILGTCFVISRRK